MAGLGACVPGFVGRSTELRLLDRILDAAADGVGCVVSVTGVAGIGKSWFCGEAVHRARDHGFATVRAGCWPGGGAPPLWPWHEVLRELIGEDAAGLLVDDGGGAAVDPERFSRFVAVRAAIARACERRPALVVIDDLHDADPGAVLLSQFIGRQAAAIPLVLVVSRRTGDGHDRYEPAADDHATAVELHGFDRAETAAFLGGLGHPITDEHLLTVLVRLTGGHPLHLQQVAASGCLDGAAELGFGPLAEAIRSAVEAVSPGARGRLAYASVLGSEPTCADAAATAGVAAEVMRAAIGEAAVAGLTTVLPGGRYCYAHALVREAFERLLTPAELATAHARAAAVLASRIAGDSDGWRRLARYAHHCLAAATRSVQDAATAVDACRTAARAMVAGFAYEQAASLLAAAVATDEQMLSAPTPAVLLTEWAEAVLRCGRLAEARDLFDRAVTAAEREGDLVLFARAGLGLGGVWVNEHRTTVAWERMAGLQQRALDGLGPGQEVLRQRLRMRLAVERLYRHRGTVASVRAALAETRRLGDGQALAEGLSLCHHALLTAEHTRERLPLAEELIAVAATAGDGLLALLGLCWRTVDLFQLGDPRAAASLTELTERIDALGCLSVRYIAECMTVMTLLRAGRLGEAERCAHACLELGVRVGDADAHAFFGTHLTMIRWLQGREAEVLAAISDLTDSPTLNPAEFGFRATAALLSVRSGNPESARNLLAPLTGAGLGNLPDSSTWLAGMAIIAQTAAALGDAATAREAYGLLAPYADLPIVPSLAVTCMGSAHRPLGLAAGAFGADDRAIAHLEAAVAANR
ncbi:ATP-binding protein, partial [Actinoplanes sp. NPDC024001]|uniref:ATP-binding protein n=1 Tax=Actinoplanes sp. NPDC024001 TaxID=3154598 RepID=UPI0033C2A560